jgi:hypothetical protein
VELYLEAKLTNSTDETAVGRTTDSSKTNDEVVCSRKVTVPVPAVKVVTLLAPTVVVV